MPYRTGQAQLLLREEMYHLGVIARQKYLFIWPVTDIWGWGLGESGVAQGKAGEAKRGGVGRREFRTFDKGSIFG